MLSLLIGPGLGLLGSAISGVFKFFEKKQELQAAREQHAHEVELTKLNLEARGREMENELWLAQVQATAGMLQASYEHDTGYGPVSRGAATWLRWVRPTLMGLLWITVVTIYFAPATDAPMRERIVLSVIGTFEMAAAWWWGGRMMERWK